MARTFDGASTQYLRATSCPVSGYPFTLVAWARFTTVNQYECVLSVGDAAGTYYFALRLQTDNTIQAMCFDGGTKTATTVGTIIADTYYLLAAVYTASNDRTVWLGSGENVNNTAAAGAITTDATAIGVSADSTPFGPMYGDVSYAAIYNTSLVLTDIARLEAGADALTVKPENLVFYAPLWRDEDVDYVGGISLTAFNAPTISEQVPIFGRAMPFYSFPGAAAPIVRVPRYGFTNFQIPGIV